MKLKLAFEFTLFEKRSHHKPITDEMRKKERLKLKGNCEICGKKITGRYRRKFCGARCAAIHNKNRKHNKKI